MRSMKSAFLTRVFYPSWHFCCIWRYSVCRVWLTRRTWLPPLLMVGDSGEISGAVFVFAFFREKSVYLGEFGPWGQAAAWHDYVQHLCYHAEICAKTPISGAFWCFVNKNLISKGCFSVQLLPTAVWKPLFMRLPEGYPWKALLSQERLRQPLPNSEHTPWSHPEKHYSRKRD